MFYPDWLILRILHQSFEIERPEGHWLEVVVHLNIHISYAYECMMRTSVNPAVCTCPDPPSENRKAKEFLINTGLVPMENHKAIKPAFNVGPSSARQRNAI